MKKFLTCLVVVAATAVATARVAMTNSENQEIDYSDKSPKQLIKVRFPSGACVLAGNELTPTQVKDEPCVSYPADKHCYYTFVFLGRIHGDRENLSASVQGKGSLLTEDRNRLFGDPDYCFETDSIYREYLHWLVVNIPGNNFGKGEVFAQYISSAPPKGNGFHRYTFLVYKQPRKLHFDEKKLNNTSIKGRDKFCVSKFSDKYCLGDPVAANYYRAQYDDYVPEVYKKLGAEYVIQDPSKYINN